jgi:iron complex transport system ATP-binding protein
MRRLVLEGWQVSAGALNLGDADQQMAEALGVTYPLMPPFEPMDAAASERASVLALAADAIVVADVPFGRGNLANLRAVAEAAERGVRTVLLGDIEGRDFCDGAARALWERALAAGAQRAGDADAAVAALGEGPR